MSGTSYRGVRLGGLFSARPQVRRGRGAPVGLPDRPDGLDADPREEASDPLFGPTPQIPADLDDLVVSYGKGDIDWPSEASAPQPTAQPPRPANEAELRARFKTPLAPERACPTGRLGGIAGRQAQTIKSKPDWDSREYGTATYRDPQGRIQSTPLRPLSAIGAPLPVSAPAGSTMLFEAHNHPEKAMEDLAISTRGYPPDLAHLYASGPYAKGPGEEDMAWAKEVEKSGISIAPDFRSIIIGPDGRMRCY